MTDELKKIFFSPQISDIFYKHNWMINLDSNNEYHSYFVGEIADYYLNIQHCKDKIYFQFTLDIEIHNSITKELLILINIANKYLKEGVFIYDFKFSKIKYNLISHYSTIIEIRTLYDFLKIKLDLIQSLFHNFVSGVHTLVYGEKTDCAKLELLFLDNKGTA